MPPLLHRIAYKLLPSLRRTTAQHQFNERMYKSAIENFTDDPQFAKDDKAYGFNRQSVRKSIFAELCNTFKFEEIIETGTFIGNTTYYMSKESNLPIHTTEIDPVIYKLARHRLKPYRDIHCHLNDSRSFLKELSKAPTHTQKTTFFYLDAHWGEDVPLAAEIDTIATHWEKFAIVVDDFHVPDDLGYGYDHYPNGKNLELQYIQPVLDKHQLLTYFPNQNSQQESGAKRGSITILPKSLEKEFSTLKKQ